MGNYAKAEPLLQEALEIAKDAFGPNHPSVATSLNNLAILYSNVGDYAKAEPLLQQALQIDIKALGPEHPDVATGLNNLATLYSEMGDYAKAESLYEQALQIWKKALGEEHPYTAGTLNNLAVLYNHLGEYDKAEAVLQQVLRIAQKVLGPEHPDTVTSLGNLANLYEDMGSYGKAEPLLQQVLQIQKKVLGPEHADVATSLDNLATLYDHLGEYDKAEPLYKQALQIRKKVLGEERPDTAISLNNLALLYDHLGEYDKAEPLYKQALQIRKKVLGEERPDTAISLNNLAGLYDDKGEYDKAEPLFRQAFQIWMKVLGPKHPNTASVLENLAVLKFDLGDILAAKALARQSAQTRLAILSKVLAFTSEPERLAYQDTLTPYTLFAMFDGCDAELAAAVLRYKGVVLDSLIEDRLVAETSKIPQDRELLARLGADKRQLGQFLLQTPNQPTGDVNKKIEALEHEVEQIEGQLARHVAGLGRARRALGIMVEQVQAVLPQDGALIEYVRYAHYLGKRKGERRYGAVVLPAAGNPIWVPLGPAANLEQLVASYQKSARGETDAIKLEADLRKLHDQIWMPVERVLQPGIKRVIFSPDGQLNFVSFATLLTADGHFLAERYALQYVASGRDLLHEASPPAEHPTTVVFANPDFERPASLSNTSTTDGEGRIAVVGAGPHGAEKHAIEEVYFDSLSGTQQEADRLVSAFNGWHWNTEALTGPQASKAALRQVHAPYVLHLATHGFFVEPAAPVKAPSLQPAALSFGGNVSRSKFFENPMHCSGLALAGAQRTLEAWRDGQVPPVDNDGIVTAEDVAALDLHGTWLVTLSACDTGSGEAKAGEGVLGLRRGFVEAGAQNLLMTLWPIDDRVTVRIMSDFYSAAHERGNAAQALAEVQREWLLALRDGKGEKFEEVKAALTGRPGLAAAVRSAGPFILSAQGKP
jgi:CHAT domain-containing protein/Tfp pilus assembly protein PilF